MKQSKTRKPYRARELSSVSVDALLARATGKLVVAVDVAKEKMVAAVMNQEQEVLTTVKWCHPAKSAAFYDFVEEYCRPC